MKASKTAKTARSTGSAKAASGARWEYQIVRPLDRTGLAEEAWGKQLGGQLSDLGSEGWELCGQAGTGHFIFKRAK